MKRKDSFVVLNLNESFNQTTQNESIVDSRDLFVGFFGISEPESFI